MDQRASIAEINQKIQVTEAIRGLLVSAALGAAKPTSEAMWTCSPSIAPEGQRLRLSSETKNQRG
jgi:hypothetical protein